MGRRLLIQAFKHFGLDCRDFRRISGDARLPRLMLKFLIPLIWLRFAVRPAAHDEALTSLLRFDFYLASQKQKPCALIKCRYDIGARRAPLPSDGKLLLAHGPL